MVTVVRGLADTRFQDLANAASEGIAGAFKIRQDRRKLEERTDTFMLFMEKAREGGLADEEIIRGGIEVTNDPIAGFQLGNQLINARINREEAENRRKNELAVQAQREAELEFKKEQALITKEKDPEKVDIFSTKGTAKKKIFVPKGVVALGADAIDSFVEEKHPGFTRTDPNVSKITPSDLLSGLAQKVINKEALSESETLGLELLTKAFTGDPIDELVKKKIQEQFPTLGTGKFRTPTPVDKKQQDATDTEIKGQRDGSAPPSKSDEDGVALSLLTVSEDRLAQMTQQEVQALFDTLDKSKVDDPEDVKRILDIKQRYNLK